MKGFEVVSKVQGERRFSRTEHFESNEDVTVKYKDFEFLVSLCLA